MAQQAQSTKLNIRYGHSDTHVVMVISQHVNQIGLSPAEVDAMIDELQKMKVQLAAHQAAPKQGQTPKAPAAND